MGCYPLPPGGPGTELGARMSRERPREPVLAPGARGSLPQPGALGPAGARQGECPPGGDGGGRRWRGPDLSAAPRPPPQVQYPLVDTQPRLCLKVSAPGRGHPGRGQHVGGHSKERRRGAQHWGWGVQPHALLDPAQPPGDPSEPHPGLTLELGDSGGPSGPQSPASPAHIAGTSSLSSPLCSSPPAAAPGCDALSKRDTSKVSSPRGRRAARLAGGLRCVDTANTHFLPGSSDASGSGSWDDRELVHGRKEGNWGVVLGLNPPTHSLEDDRPASRLSGPPPGHLLLAQCRPFPGAPVSPKEDVAACLPPRAPGHDPRPSLSEPGVQWVGSFLGRVADPFPVCKALISPWRPPGVEGTPLRDTVFPVTACDRPLSHPE